MADKRATDLDRNQATPDTCDPDCAEGGESGPMREAGGTTGAGNLSPAAANRTGGATSGVSDDPSEAKRAAALPPDA